MHFIYRSTSWIEDFLFDQIMFGFVSCNASILSQQKTDPSLFFVRVLVKNWLWPIITFFGVTGNILVIIVLTKRRMIMSSTNNYLIALALVDVVYLLLTLIMNTAQNPCFRNTSTSQIILTICRPIADFASNSSVWLTVTFTVERWVAITYPLQSRTWCTVHHARKIILSVLFASLFCTSPSAFEMKLVKIIETSNLSDTIIVTSRIRAERTALGKSVLYHRIYFNFVTFVIIWIPLLLLLIFNTILIYYVRRSKTNSAPTGVGEVELRRHSRGNQGEQRKTTIMLIAVVIVFTVCQIPQAISLSLQSFFLRSIQTPAVLIYNNFANCLVALNASINFLLYCCFSDRFRATFRSSFTFNDKYFSHYIDPRLSVKTYNSTSFDQVSATYSFAVRPLPRHSSKIVEQINENNAHSWSSSLAILSKLKSKKRIDRNRIQLQRMRLSQDTESMASSPSTSVLKSPSSIIRTTPSFILPVVIDREGDEASPLCSSSERHSLTNDSPLTREIIWVKRRPSNKSMEKYFHWPEILDATV